MKGILREIKNIQESGFRMPKTHIGILILLQLVISAAALARIEALKHTIDLIGGECRSVPIIRATAFLAAVTLLTAASRFLLARYLERCKDSALRSHIHKMADRNLDMASWKDAHTGTPDRYILMTKELDGFVDSIYRGIPDLIAWMVLIPLFAAYLGTVSILALIVVLTAELAVWRLSDKIQAALPELNRDRREKYGKWMNYLNRTFENYDILRTSISPKRYEEIFDRKAFRWNDSSIQGLERLLTMDQIQNAGGILIETVLLLIGVLGLLTGRYEVGGVYALVASVQAIKQKFAQMPIIAEEVYEAQSHYQRLAEFCDENEFTAHGGDAAEGFRELELRQLSFGYRKAAQIITGLDYSFHRGNMYAILGEAGTGKTTILLLIARMLEETGGKLYYNGADIDDIPRDSLWKQMIYVSRPCFIRGTVEDNIRFGRETFDARLYGEIRKYDGRLLDRTLEDEEGSAFSAGERQRILIYRALCAGCALVLLDEPFSNLDQAMERKMIGLMEQSAKAGKCIIFTTHRTAVLDRCNGIVNMNK